MPFCSDGKSVGGAVQIQPNASQEGGQVAKRRIYGWINSILSGDKFSRFFVFFPYPAEVPEFIGQ